MSHRIARLAALFAALIASSLTSLAGAPRESTCEPGPTAVGAIGLTVSDLDEAVRFYTKALSFSLLGIEEQHGDDVERLSGVFGVRLRTARLRLGDEVVELTDFLAPEGRPIPPDARSNDLWFQHIAIVVSDMDAAYARLRQFAVRHVSPGPQTLPTWNANAGGISAFYFKDPDGHVLELIRFPADKGDPKWRRPTDRLFLGIDHTAIVVADTDRSLAFYQNTLGLRIVGTSENYGVEQERLNGVFGARLRITSLRGASGPGVELLEYLAPGPGREFPPDAAANDLLHWHTTFTVTDPRFEDQLRTARVRRVSPSVGAFGGGAACQIRDPDGHAAIVIQRIEP